MHIRTARLTIRNFTMDDLEAYAPIVADPDVMRFLDGPQSEEQTREYLQEMIELSVRGLGRYAVELNDDATLIGMCGFRPAGAYIDFGYRYARHVWGRGIAYEAAVAVRRHGLEELKMRNMEAGALKANVASVRILEKMGFAHRQETLHEGQPAVLFRDDLSFG